MSRQIDISGVIRLQESLFIINYILLRYYEVIVNR